MILILLLKKDFNFLKKDDQLLNDQYFIQITKDNIEIKYNTYGGKLYALISLVHLIDFYQTKLPICTIQDNPKYNGEECISIVQDNLRNR